MPLYACNGCVKNLFVTDEELIERFTGKQLFTFGFNDAGQLGDQSRVNRSSPVQTISTGTNWKQTQIGRCNGIGIKTDGSLWVWGTGVAGQMGNNAATSRSSPVQTISAGTNWRNAAIGWNAAAAIKTDGTLWLWGAGVSGTLGNQNSTVNVSSPVQTISTGANWKQVSVGCATAGAIKTDGSLWLWGQATAGILGNQSVVNRSSPVQTVSNVTTWKQVRVGGLFTGAVKTDGSLWLWGTGTDGQLGRENVISQSSPVQTVSNVTTWKQVSVGYYNAAAIKTDGSLWTWGQGSQGKLGSNSITSRSSPVQTVSAGTNWRSVDAGFQHVGAIKTDGSLWLWGGNATGYLGANNITVRSSPVQTISGGTGWRSIGISASSTSTPALRNVE
jgi:alpha-tubulin suppressor-like RCC1 family protein